MQIFSHKFVYLAQFQSAIWPLIFSVEYYRFTRTRIVRSELTETILLEKHRHLSPVSALDEICQQKHEDHYYLVGDHFSLLMPSIDFLFDG